MANRFNSQSVENYGSSGLKTGYEGPEGDLFVPSCGIEDVDRAVFNFFDSDINFQVTTQDGDKPVPVIFASGEKWALNKRMRAVRDKMNTLILPLITVIRTQVEQDPTRDVTGRGINQQCGEMVVKRRLDTSDRGFQSLMNRLNIRNQTNLAIEFSEDGNTDRLATRREIGDLSLDPNVLYGNTMLSDRKKNIWETIVIPAPKFFTATYEVKFWTQHIIQMDQMLETLINSMLPQGQAWKIETPKGYWFIATIDGNTLESEANIDDMSEKERIVKYKFAFSVPAYTVAGREPGAPIPIKRYISCPTVEFNVSPSDNEEVSQNVVDDPFLGADDPTLPIDDAEHGTRRRDMRATGRGRVYPAVGNVDPHDPALLSYARPKTVGRWRKISGYDRTGRVVEHYVRVKSVNKRGEAVLSDITDLGGLTIVVTDR